MKRFSVFLMCLLGLLGCNSAPVESNDIPDEDVAEVQAALGSCNRPTGDAGDQTAPVTEHVTGVHVNATHDYILDVQVTTDATGATRTDQITFGVGQAKITGGGWSGPKISQIISANPGPLCDAADLNQYCLIFRGTGSADGKLKFHKDYAKPTWIGTANMGMRISKIRGYGRWSAQTLKFYKENTDGAITTFTLPFEGAALDACTDPWM